MKVSRRSFVGGAGAAGALAGGAFTGEVAQAQLVYAVKDWHSAEFEQLVKAPGRIRQVFDVKPLGDGGWLGAVKNSFNGFQFGFGVPPEQIRIVLALHGAANLLNFNDAMWAKYRLGEYLKVNDPASEKPAERNPFYAGNAAGPGPANVDPNDRKSVYQDYSIQALQGRGLQLLSCHNSTEMQVRAMVAQFGWKTPVEEIVADLQAHLLPGAIAVPAMVAAIGILQSEGKYSYIVG